MGDGLRERQKYLRKKKILQVGARLFRRRGFAQTHMEEIAEAAGLAVGTLYNYFPSKTDIAFELFQQSTATAIERGHELLAQHPSDPGEALTELILVYLRVFAAQDRALWREAARALLAAPEDRPSLDLDLQVIGQVAELLRGLQAKGQVAAELDPERGAVTIYALLISWYAAFSEWERLSEADMAREVRSTIELLTHGLLPQPA